MKTVLGQLNWEVEQIGPGELSPFAVCMLQQPGDTRHAHRKRANCSLMRQPMRCERGSDFAAVERRQLFSMCVPVHEETAPSQSGGLWFHEAKDELHDNHGINCVPALAQNLAPSLSCKRIGRDHHMASGRDWIACNFSTASVLLASTRVLAERSCGKNEKSEDKRKWTHTNSRAMH